MLTKDLKVAKIIDFGTAKLTDDLSATTGIGSRFYSPPEQYDHRHVYDPRLADCFSIGAITYVMLSGVMPFASQPAWKVRGARACVCVECVRVHGRVLRVRMGASWSRVGDAVLQGEWDRRRQSGSGTNPPLSYCLPRRSLLLPRVV